MYIHREIEPLLLQAAKMFPAVLVTGPRQSGKSTLLAESFPDAHRVSFDDPVTNHFASSDPTGFLASLPDKAVILDEIQYVPEIFSYLKMEIDSDRSRKGRWLMSGSQQFNMMNQVSDSLAGRIAVINLFPFCYREHLSYLQRIEARSAMSDMINESFLEKLLWYGNYPEVVLNRESRDLWISSYLRTCIERDIRQIINVQDLSLFQTFISLCAANHSQELNIASISRECGVSQPTIKRWISILQTSFIVSLLKPYHKNLGKRLIKSPKLYFVDSAIAAYLTRQGNPETLFNAVMGGAFFKGFIIMETLKSITNMGLNGELYFFRSHDGMEIDLIIELAGRIHAVEIKKTATPTSRHAEALEKFRIIAGDTLARSFIVCNAPDIKPVSRNVTALPWVDYLSWLTESAS